MGAYWVVTGSGNPDDTAEMVDWVGAANAFLGLNTANGETFGEPEQRPDGAPIYRLLLSAAVGGVYAADFVALPPGAVVAWIAPSDEAWQPAPPPIP